MENFGYVRPANLKEAISLLGAQHGKVSPLAGGTDLLGEMKDDLLAPERLVSIKHLTELRGIRETAMGLRVGASTLLAAIVESSAVRKKHPLMAVAVEKVGAPQLH